MKSLTKTQQRILDFIAVSDPAPTLREIAGHCGFKSSRAAGYHLGILKRVGALEHQPNKARSLQIFSPLQSLRKRIYHIPILGSIPAGFADRREQEVKRLASIDFETLGFKPTERTFALEVRGDSMIGKHIVEGDIVIIDHGQTPRTGDVVAALIDGESTLKTFIADKGRPHLRAENPTYPKLIPVGELFIQGVMVALIRKRR